MGSWKKRRVHQIEVALRRGVKRDKRLGNLIEHKGSCHKINTFTGAAYDVSGIMSFNHYRHELLTVDFDRKMITDHGYYGTPRSHYRNGFLSVVHSRIHEWVYSLGMTPIITATWISDPEILIEQGYASTTKRPGGRLSKPMYVVLDAFNLTTNGWYRDNWRLCYEANKILSYMFEAYRKNLPWLVRDDNGTRWLDMSYVSVIEQGYRTWASAARHVAADQMWRWIYYDWDENGEFTPFFHSEDAKKRYLKTHRGKTLPHDAAIRNLPVRPIQLA